MTLASRILPDMQILIAARSKAPKPNTIEEDRRAWSIYTALLSRPAPANMLVSDHLVRAPDVEVPIRIYRPAAASTLPPVTMYLHGGGFIRGDLDSSDSIAWGLAEQTASVVVSVDYRLSPENPYPAPFDDCYSVLQWLVSNHLALKIDETRIAIAGDSVGGLLAAALSSACRDRGGPQILAQAMIYPCYFRPPVTGSYLEFATAPGLTTASISQCRSYFLSGEKFADDFYAVPLAAHDFTRLPPTLIHTAEIDPVRDDGRLYAEKLLHAGSDFTYREAHGMIHGFMRARFESPAAQAEFDFICEFLRSYFYAGGMSS